MDSNHFTEEEFRQGKLGTFKVTKRPVFGTETVQCLCYPFFVEDGEALDLYKHRFEIKKKYKPVCKWKEALVKVPVGGEVVREQRGLFPIEKSSDLELVGYKDCRRNFSFRALFHTKCVCSPMIGPLFPFHPKEKIVGANGEKVMVSFEVKE